jgi:hypothetical protein
MVGRKRIFEGIYPNYIEEEPDNIDFDEFLIKGQNIFVLAHQPGIGKTYSVMQYLKKKIREDKDFKFFYFTDRHATIDEHTRNWKEGTYSHWEGFERICEKTKMKSLYKYHLSPKDICKTCKKKCSKYLSQFKNTSRVFAVFEFLLSNDFLDNPPNIIFLDENIKQFKSYSADIEDAKILFKRMKRDDLVELLEQSDYKTFANKIDFGKLSDEYKNYILRLAESKGKNEEELALVEKFNIFDFYQYIRWESIYGYGLKSYAAPTLYYNAFKVVANGVPAVFMDATYNPFLFRYILECYNAEGKYFGNKRFDDLNLYIFQKFHSNPKTVLYRMCPEDVLPKRSFTIPKNWEHTKEWLAPDMRTIMKIFGKNNVGIITFKEFGNIAKSFGFDVEYYGNLRGTNVLESKPVLVLIGSYLPIVASWDAEDAKEDKEYYEDLLSKYFLLNVEEKDLDTVGIEAPKDITGRFDYKLAKVKAYKYVGKTIKEILPTEAGEIYKNPAEALNNLIWFDEIYQAFHRNRGLRYPRIIFAYCWFPEPGARMFATDNNKNITGNVIGNLRLFVHNIRSEFESNIVKIGTEIVSEFFRILKEHEKDGLIEQIFTYMKQHPDAKSEDIADKFRVFKKGGKRGRDTIPITMIKKAIKILENEAKWED